MISGLRRGKNLYAERHSVVPSYLCQSRWVVIILMSARLGYLFAWDLQVVSGVVIFFVPPSLSIVFDNISQQNLTSPRLLHLLRLVSLVR